MLVRVPGIGIRGARKIIRARSFRALRFDDLKALGIVLRRARHFITAGGRYYGTTTGDPDAIKKALLPPKRFHQPSLFDACVGAATGEV